MRGKGEQSGQYGPHRENKPGRLPDTTPPPMPSGDYSYTLEIVMNMQLSIGKLTEAVDRLKSDQTAQSKKLDGISHKIYAAIILLAAIGAILTFFAKSINDAVTNRLVNPVPIQVVMPSTPTPTPKH